jgi:hypothetical protein
LQHLGSLLVVAEMICLSRCATIARLARRVAAWWAASRVHRDQLAIGRARAGRGRAPRGRRSPGRRSPVARPTGRWTPHWFFRQPVVPRRSDRDAGWLRSLGIRRLHVLVASRLEMTRQRELCETAGENVTVTKHGFESRWGHQIVVVDVLDSGFEELRKVLQTRSSCFHA